MCREEDLIVLAEMLEGNREALAEAEREGGPRLIQARRGLAGAPWISSRCRCGAVASTPGAWEGH